MISGRRALLVGTLMWVLVTIWFWPQIASFGDEVGYLGEARSVLAGHFRPLPGELGIATDGVGGGVARYPLFPSLLFAPFMAVWPRLVFSVGVAATVIICWLAARILESWGDDSAFALLLLAHPTVVLIARTATADLPLCAFMLATWWCFRNDRWRSAVACCVGLFATKATGFVVGIALIGGELLRRLPALRRGERQARAAVVTALIGIAAGFGAVIGCNHLSAGRSWFGYELNGIRPFSAGYLVTTAPVHLLHLFVLPPLLIGGAIPFWRRREFGPLAVIVGFGALMCAYFFVDSGTNRIETLVLSPRLLLPVVVFLLIGYADLLARFIGRLRAGVPAQRMLLIAATSGMAATVGFVHARWQRPAGQALAAAERIARADGIQELGVLPQAEKTGVLYAGATRAVRPADPKGSLLLCSSRSASYRAPLPAGTLSCDLAGYQSVFQADQFYVLRRAGVPEP
jgi:hypothetical protein